MQYTITLKLTWLDSENLVYRIPFCLDNAQKSTERETADFGQLLYKQELHYQYH